jgi:hypothetical protein
MQGRQAYTAGRLILQACMLPLSYIVAATYDTVYRSITMSDDVVNVARSTCICHRPYCLRLNNIPTNEPQIDLALLSCQTQGVHMTSS